MSDQVVFFDIAGTLVRGTPWHYLFKHPRVSRVRFRLMYVPLAYYWGLRKSHRMSDTRFRQHWIQLVAWLLKGIQREELTAIFAHIVQQSAAEGDFQDDVVARLKQHKAEGARVVLVSGMFDVFTAAYAEYVGADEGIGTGLGFDSKGVCTGRIVGDPSIGPGKLDFIRRYLESRGYDPDLSQHAAYADSLSDLPMLTAVGQPTATYPEQTLLAEAEQRGWPVLGTPVVEANGKWGGK